MISLRPNLVKRIERLPKPTNVAGAMQPLFEAVSNAIHATQERYGENVSSIGRVIVTVITNRKKEGVSASVKDNGSGLDKSNWRAFTTTDTDNKIQTGGKGVGRLMWLDCFENIKVSSVFKTENGQFHRREFRFKLAMDDQIQDIKNEDLEGVAECCFCVRFEGLRNNGYRKEFPGRNSFVFQHLTSHFLPMFIGGQCPQLSVHVGDETREYPDAISDIVHRREATEDVETKVYGQLKLTLMECDKVASAYLKGQHFVHFVAHNRTVHSQCINGKLGFTHFGPNNDRVFHAIVTGAFLDKNINQERTAFVFDDAVIEKIINEICWERVEKFLAEPLALLKGQQQNTIGSITSTYPSVAFAELEELQMHVPSGEIKPDAIYGHLARERFRRDKRQADKIRQVLGRLKAGEVDINSFDSALVDASNAIEEAEQRSLAEYIVRRKVVLDFVEILLQKVRDDTQDSAYQREDILHSFICPLRVKSINSANSKVEPAASHDLWIIDERLTFAQYFSSDVEFSKLSEASTSGDRPDLLIFDYVHGLRQTEESSKVLLVEFKRPGRTTYNDNENPQYQVERYVQQLQSARLQDVRGRPIQLNENTIFYCYIIADIVGKMNEWTFSWQRTANGLGRIYRPNSGFHGSIELLGWDQLIKDARERNQAFFDRAGISGDSYFSADQI